MNMGKILAIHSALKNGIEPPKVDEIAVHVPRECPECDGSSEVSCPGCNGQGHIDLFDEKIPCNQCGSLGKRNCVTCALTVREDQNSYEPISSTSQNNGMGGTVWQGRHEYWSRDEMDFPEEDKFRTDIAGEKKTDQEVNDHDLTVDDQLEDEGLAESHKLPASWPLDFKQNHRKEVSKVLDEYTGFGDVRNIETRYDEMSNDITTDIKFDDGTVIKINTQKYNGRFGHNVFVLRAKHEVKEMKTLSELFREQMEQLDKINEETVNESAPPDQEEWVKKNKKHFIDEYGKEKGLEVLYATAWKRSKHKK